jgi:hypothetical protein
MIKADMLVETIYNDLPPAPTKPETKRKKAAKTPKNP